MESISGNPAGISLFQQVSNQGQTNAVNTQPQSPKAVSSSSSDTVNISQQARDLLEAETAQPAPLPKTAALHSGTDIGSGPR